MSGSEVPDELMKVAREVLRGVKCADDAGWADVAADIIARALAAERERATLAEREKCRLSIEEIACLPLSNEVKHGVCWAHKAIKSFV